MENPIIVYGSITAGVISLMIIFKFLHTKYLLKSGMVNNKYSNDVNIKRGLEHLGRMNLEKNLKPPFFMHKKTPTPTKDITPNSKTSSPRPIHDSSESESQILPQIVKSSPQVNLPPDSSILDRKKEEDNFHTTKSVEVYDIEIHEPEKELVEEIPEKTIPIDEAIEEAKKLPNKPQTITQIHEDIKYNNYLSNPLTKAVVWAKEKRKKGVKIAK